jgi:hypothetical protein
MERFGPPLFSLHASIAMLLYLLDHTVTDLPIPPPSNCVTSSVSVLQRNTKYLVAQQILWISHFSIKMNQLVSLKLNTVKCFYTFATRDASYLFK